jgi:citrate lyase subunit beta/citryl-CoA lyase
MRDSKGNWAPAGPALLFCPADRPERFQKAAQTADVVILDLEDGVGSADRVIAREALVSTHLDPSRTIVRINAVGTSDYALDVEAINQTNYEVVMLAKTESAHHVSLLAPRRVIALCETPAGIIHVSEIAEADGTDALFWGAEDLIASLRGRSSRHLNGAYRDVALHARSQVLLAAGAADVVAIDSVYLDIADLDGLREEADDGVASGFAAKACIHPNQVAVVRDVYLPSQTDVQWARAVADASIDERGAFTYKGQMVDAPVLRQAEEILDQYRRYHRDASE